MKNNKGSKLKIFSTVAIASMGIMLVGCGTGTSTTEYKVSVDYGFDSEYETEYDINSGDSLSTLSTPVREGYTFDGWYADDEFEDEYTFEDAITGNTTIYVKWINNYDTLIAGLEEDAYTIPSDTTVFVSTGETLTVAKDLTVEGKLVNYGTISISAETTFTIAADASYLNEGAYISAGTFVNNGTILATTGSNLYEGIKYNTENGTVLMMNDIELPDVYNYIPVAYGTLDGNGYTMSGIENAYNEGEVATNNSYYCMSIQEAHNYTIKNITINGENAASFIYYSTGDSFTMEDVTTTGYKYTELYASEANNYAPIIILSFAETTTFDNCVNEMDIKISSSSAYFSAFLGGYVQAESTSYDAYTLTFNNCVNYGDLTGAKPSVYVGNASKMNTSKLTIEMTGTNANYGTVTGISNVAYFCGSSNTLNDSYLNGTSEITFKVDGVTAVSGETVFTSADIDDNSSADLVTAYNPGIAYELDGNYIKVTDATEGWTYKVTYFTYATAAGNVEAGEWTGTLSTSASFDLESGVTSDYKKTIAITSVLGEYEFTEDAYSDIAMKHEFDATTNTLYVQYAESFISIDKTSVTGILTAYDAEGNLVAIQSLS